MREERPNVPGGRPRISTGQSDPPASQAQSPDHQLSSDGPALPPPPPRHAAVAPSTLPAPLAGAQPPARSVADGNGEWRVVGPRGKGARSGQVPRGGARNTLDWQEWRQRERARGYESPPNANEFSDLNEFVSGKNDWVSRGFAMPEAGEKRATLDLHGWKLREATRGYASPPNPLEFRDQGEFSLARSEWIGRGLAMPGVETGGTTMTAGSVQEREPRRSLDTQLTAASPQGEHDQLGHRGGGPQPSNITARVTHAAEIIMQMGTRAPTQHSDSNGEGDDPHTPISNRGGEPGAPCDLRDEGEMEWTAGDQVTRTDSPTQGQRSHDLNRDQHRVAHQVEPAGLSVAQTDNLSFDGGSGLRIDEQIPTHLLPAVREWLKERGIHVDLPSSPLQTRVPFQETARRGTGNVTQSPGKMRPSRLSSRIERTHNRSPYSKQRLAQGTTPQDHC
jgi:hypothetical protein